MTSGTATLEAALWKIPQVVCYRAHPISYLVARFLVKIKFISLVNLIVNKEAVKELIQKDYTIENILIEIDSLIMDKARRKQQLDNYQQLNMILGRQKTSTIVAEKVINMVSIRPL